MGQCYYVVFVFCGRGEAVFYKTDVFKIATFISDLGYGVAADEPLVVLSWRALTAEETRANDLLDMRANEVRRVVTY